jgi:hypothetical protein
MARSILTPDMVSIGLLMSEGNINITMEELISAIMDYQKRSCRIFGESDEDYLLACFHLVNFETTLLARYMDFEEFNRLTFRQIIPEMLRFTEMYVNDEGEHWLENRNLNNETIERFFGLDRKGFDSKMQLREEMIEFFGNLPGNGPEDVRLVTDFMARKGITAQILIKCSSGNNL